MSEYTSHYSVLKNEVMSALASLELLNQENPLVADFTFGGGGHSFSILEQFQNVQLLATDQDPEALSNGNLKISQIGLDDRIKLIDTNFAHFFEKIGALGYRPPFLSAALYDLGVSSHHFDSSDRGFSFRFDAKLDMRMNNRENESAKDVVNTLSEKELADLLWYYGEEKHSRKIASKIVNYRAIKEIETTKELEVIVTEAYPVQDRYGRINPATKTFQALRIYVNRELEVLEQAIEKCADLILPGGIIMVISFHSLEDRIVKNLFKKFEDEKDFQILTKKPIIPSEQEISENSRSRSAKLRIVRRIASGETKRPKGKINKYGKK